MITHGVLLVQWCDGYLWQVLITCITIATWFGWQWMRSQNKGRTRNAFIQTDPELGVDPTICNDPLTVLCGSEGHTGLFISKSVLESKVFHTNLCTCLVGAGYTNINQLKELRKCKRC